MSKVKTNAMRILDAKKIPYDCLTYEIDEQIDGISVANKIARPVETVFKTLVTRGNSKGIYVFVIPVAKALDLKKAAKVVKEKKIEMIAVIKIQSIFFLLLHRDVCKLSTYELFYHFRLKFNL